MPTIKIDDGSITIDETMKNTNMTWGEFKEQVAKFAHEKCPDLFYFSAKSEVVIGKLSMDQHGSIWVSYVDNRGEDNWVQLADDRTYSQMLKVMESVCRKHWREL